MSFFVKCDFCGTEKNCIYFENIDKWTCLTCADKRLLEFTRISFFPFLPKPFFSLFTYVLRLYIRREIQFQVERMMEEVAFELRVASKLRAARRMMKANV